MRLTASLDKSHSASHRLLDHPKRLCSSIPGVAWIVVAIDIIFGDIGPCSKPENITESTARSTSSQRRKRSATSVRRVANVSGERKRPRRRCTRDFGRKEESSAIAFVCCVPIGVEEPRESRMTGSNGVRVFSISLSTGVGAVTRCIELVTPF
jgi:hypothetical protein